jgi:uncharacterized damage-inducible protein DinB
MAVTVASAFVSHSAHLLDEDFFPRIRVAVEHLTDEQVWWRPNEASNSIGNLMLHLRGNMMQWIVNGVGGKPFVRDREKEFSERSVLPRQKLVAMLEDAVAQSATVLRQLDPATLNTRKAIQGNDVTVLEAVYHVVEHFSMHTGQILLLTKMLTSKDLQLYEFPGGAARKRW